MSTAPRRHARLRSAPERSAEVRLAPRRSAPLRSAPFIGAPTSTAPRSEAPCSFVCSSLTFLKSNPSRFAPVRSAPDSWTTSLSATAGASGSTPTGDGAPTQNQTVAPTRATRTRPPSASSILTKRRAGSLARVSAQAVRPNPSQAGRQGMAGRPAVMASCRPGPVGGGWADPVDELHRCDSLWIRDDAVSGVGRVPIIWMKRGKYLPRPAGAVGIAGLDRHALIW